MYGIFTYIYHKNQPNVGKYTIHDMDPMGMFSLKKPTSRQKKQTIIPKNDFWANFVENCVSKYLNDQAFF